MILNYEYILCGNQLVSTLQDKVIPKTREIHTDVCYTYRIMSIEELEQYEKDGKIGYKFLNDISCNNEAVKQVICECIGCMLAPIKPFRKVFVWYGNDINGKNILLKVIQAIMGNLLTYTNIVNTKKISLNGLHKGIANVTDNTSTSIKNTPLLNNIINGHNIEIDMKYTEPIFWIPNTQLVVCSYNVPHVAQELLNNAVFVPFHSTYEFDIDLIFKLLGTSIKLDKKDKNTDSIRYIMTKAIIAYREAYERGHLTETEENKKLLEIFIEENQGDIKSFYNYLVEREAGIEGLEKWINNKPLYEIYEEFAKYLGYNSRKEIKNMTQRAFLNNFNKLLPNNIQKKNATVCGRSIKKYIVS